MKIDIISGFLGAGKTTFIKRLLETSIGKEKVVLIENEFGEVSVDSDFLADSKIDIQELSQGCICCSLVGDFSKSLNEVIEKYNPDRILIEPSGVGKLSDVEKAIADANLSEYLNSLICLVDVTKAKMYTKNFGEFFLNQIEYANTIILSRTDVAKPEKVEEAISIIRKHNESCVLVTTSIKELSDEALLKAYEGVNEDFKSELLESIKHEHEHHHDEECCCGHHHDHEHHHDEECCCGHHHDHEHHHDEECCCGHHHDHEHHHEEECCCGHHHDHEHHHEEECCCGHHHDHEHHHDEECCCGHHHDHEHHHEEECCCGHHHDHEHHHEEECCCGHHHDHEHHHDEECNCGHHHHHADEIFTSVGIETAKKFDIDELNQMLVNMSMGEYGMIVRAKGIICGTDGLWYQFNLTPGEVEIDDSNPCHIGKICVIGSKIDEHQIKELF